MKPEDNVLQVAESVSVTSGSTFIARQIELDKERAEFEARGAFAKVEAKAKHALKLAKAEEQFKVAAAKLNAERKLIVLSERGSSVAVSSKADSIGSSINLLGGRSAISEAFWGDSKPHIKKIQVENCAEEKSSSLLEGSLNGNVVRF